MKYALAPRQVAFGLFQLSDLVVGAQTSLSVATYLHQETQNPR